ncbi:MAG: DNA polymerase III subunit delta [Pontibacterium sp.]
MKIKHEQLARRLSGEAKSVYLVTGDEPLLSEESCDLLRQYFKEQGFTEREVMHVDSSFKWEYLLETANALSLFADRKVIELRLGTKLNKQASEILRQYLSSPSPDNVLLIIAGKLDAGTKKSAWFKAIDQQGIILEIWPVEAHQLPNWIRQRATQIGLKLDDSAVALMADRIEGNLLAAKQELQKLRLLFGDAQVNADDVISAVTDSSRYDIYSLTEAALLGQPARCHKILQGLKADGTEAAIVLWALSREIRALYSILLGQSAGLSFEALCQRDKIWGKRKPQLGQACQRLRQSTVEQLLSDCGTIDKLVKGAEKGDPWVNLSGLCLTLAGLSLPVF